MINKKITMPSEQICWFHNVCESVVDFSANKLIVIIKSWETKAEAEENRANFVLNKTSVPFDAWDESLLNNIEYAIENTEWQAYNSLNEIIPSKTIDELKIEKRRDIDKWRSYARFVDVIVPVAGIDYMWQANKVSQDLLATAINFATIGINAAPPIWRTSDNIDVNVSLDDLKAIAAAMANRTSMAYYHSFQLKAEVDAATTQEELEAILW